MGRILLAGLLLLASAFCARAEEKITSFHSRIEVMKDASVKVTDDIEAVAEGNIIKRGLLYSLPLTREGRGVSYKVVGVERDGKPEPFHVDKSNGSFDLYTGSADVFLTSGTHKFRITYTSPLQVSLFEDFDEIYWNVTGAWPFPIGAVSATIVLPEGADAIRTYAYTGPAGTQGQDYVAQNTPAGATVVATRPFQAGEQLTVATAFPKGFVVLPWWAVLWQFVLDYSIFGLFPPLLLLAWFGAVWRRVGKDPEIGPVIPEYAPPQSMSAAAVAYFMSEGRDREKSLAAAVLSLCVKGWLSIGGAEDSMRFLLKDGKSGAPPLDPDEKGFVEALRERMQAKGKVSSVDNVRAALQSLSAGTPMPGRLLDALQKVDGELQKRSIQASPDAEVRMETGAPKPQELKGEDIFYASAALYRSLAQRFSARFVETNFRFWFWGSALAIGLDVLAFWLLAGVNDEEMRLFTFFVPITFVIVLLRRAFARLRLFYGTILFLPFALLSMWFCFVRMVPAVEAASLASMGLVLGVFSWLLERPAEVPLKLRNRLLGLKHYLVMAEQERLEFAHPLGKTPEVFERFLPFALALGVENEWAEAFAEALANYKPEWDATGLIHGDYSNSVTRMSRNFRPVYVAAPSRSYVSSSSSSSSHSGSTYHYHSTSSGSSSRGSSGGGHSGGGGGGGRRGGW